MESLNNGLELDCLTFFKRLFFILNMMANLVMKKRIVSFLYSKKLITVLIHGIKTIFSLWDNTREKEKVTHGNSQNL